MTLAANVALPALIVVLVLIVLGVYLLARVAGSGWRRGRDRDL